MKKTKLLCLGLIHKKLPCLLIFTPWSAVANVYAHQVNLIVPGFNWSLKISEYSYSLFFSHFPTPYFQCYFMFTLSSSCSLCQSSYRSLISTGLCAPVLLVISILRVRTRSSLEASAIHWCSRYITIKNKLILILKY